MEDWSNGKEKTEYWKNGMMEKENRICGVCNQYSITPILQFSPLI
jgi:hypothetical protein